MSPGHVCPPYRPSQRCEKRRYALRLRCLSSPIVQGDQGDPSIPRKLPSYLHLQLTELKHCDRHSTAALPRTSVNHPLLGLRLSNNLFNFGGFIRPPRGLKFSVIPSLSLTSYLPPSILWGVLPISFRKFCEVFLARAFGSRRFHLILVQLSLCECINKQLISLCIELHSEFELISSCPNCWHVPLIDWVSPEFLCSSPITPMTKRVTSTWIRISRHPWTKCVVWLCPHWMHIDTFYIFIYSLWPCCFLQALFRSSRRDPLHYLC